MRPNSFISGRGEPLQYKTGTTRLQALFRTLYDTNLDKYAPLGVGSGSFYDTAAAFLYGLGDGFAGGSDTQATGEGPLPDYVDRFLRWLQQGQNGRSKAQILELFLGKSDTPWPQDEDPQRGARNYGTYRLNRGMADTDSGGHVFGTEQGLVGMASDRVRKGDVVCVLFGCPLPLVMGRAAGDRWQIVQSCFVYGIMHGEAIEEMRDGKLQTQEFNIV